MPKANKISDWYSEVISDDDILEFLSENSDSENKSDDNKENSSLDSQTESEAEAVNVLNTLFSKNTAIVYILLSVLLFICLYQGHTLYNYKSKEDAYNALLDDNEALTDTINELKKETQSLSLLLTSSNEGRAQTLSEVAKIKTKNISITKNFDKIKTSNYELKASNDRLKILNEELKTSNDELKASNDELINPAKNFLNNLPSDNASSFGIPWTDNDTEEFCNLNAPVSK